MEDQSIPSEGRKQGRFGFQMGTPAYHAMTGRGTHKPNPANRKKQHITKSSQRTPNEDYSSGLENKPKTQTFEDRRPFSYPNLDKLYDKDPKEVVLFLCQETRAFRRQLDESHMTKDYFLLLLRVLARASICETVPQSVIHMINTLNGSNFFTQHVTPRLANLLVEMTLGTFNSRSEALIRYALTLIKCTMTRTPSRFLEMSPLVSLLDTILQSSRQNGIDLDDEILEDLDELQEQVNSEIEKVRTGQKKLQKRGDYTEDVSGETNEPPNNFRYIAVFPGFADIMTNIEPFLRPNIPKGAFRDADHYLDVQFRLLREDFIAPMRDGITKYLNNQSLPKEERVRVTDIRTYESVKIRKPVCHGAEGICHVVTFQNSNLKNVRWSTSKRLLYGSLVCLSKNNFKTIMFATVAKRDVSDLEQGMTTLKFQTVDEALDESASESFTMIESAAFFEAYRYVLEGLQELNGDSLPFSKHIVYCENDVSPPKYLREQNTAYYDISCLLTDADEEIRQSCTNLPILELDKWPPGNAMSLDDSQLKALQTALTRELVVIQGPPGTGKTYIGLKMVDVLLNNHKRESDMTGFGEMVETANLPILVVCYTNHALDQFLEGITSFVDDGIVRVGSRSKSEKLERFQIANKRRKGTGRCIYEMMREIEKEIKNDVEDDGKMQKTFNEEEILSAMPESHKTSLLQSCSDQGVIKAWLLEKIKEMGEEDLTLQSKSEGVETRVNIEQLTEDMEARATVPKIEVEGQGEFINELRTIDTEGTVEHSVESEFSGNDSSAMMGSKVNEINLSKILDSVKNEVPSETGDGFQEDKRNTKKRKKKLKHQFDMLVRNTEAMSEEEALKINDVWSLNLHKRWQLYYYWVSQAKPLRAIRMRHNISQYERLALQLKETHEEEDLKLLKDAQVIGMTTTGAAKYRSILKQINPKIVIIEEAAEVLESHIITTITPECEHLILIGDHQQLRPNPTVYELAKSYNLDISLFERMINNSLHFEKLRLQHRMRPEIAAPMKHIYENLQNHDSVKIYESVRGVGKNIFFINHQEDEELMEDIRSRSNTHEATYLVALCKYLLQQGYRPSQITILTMYTAQLIELHRLMPKDVFRGVRVCPVDNFQGEENDIILLSLVRSNQEGSIGFLNISNRVCVALSRARMGFYCIGNFQLLSQKNKLWRKITADLQTSGNIGSSLKLFCRNHPETTVNCSKSDDFKAVPNGGCEALCGYRLPCDHTCKQHCHPYDLDHEEYMCEEPCEHLCERGHKCPLPCHEVCGDCKSEMIKKIPMCGHNQLVPCYKDASTVSCQEPCLKQLYCGHQCDKQCCEPCPSQCEKLVEKEVGVCGHKQMMACHEDPLSYKCKMSCGKVLMCGHPCPNNCGEPCADKCCVQVLHDDWPCRHNYEGPCWMTAAECPMPCQSTLECGHYCKSKCGQCENGKFHVPCKMPCERLLSCSHKCNNLCHEECQTTCMETVSKTFEACGHAVKIKCCERMILCPHACRAPLSCDHRCTGKCGVCRSIGSHNICTQKCCRKLVCGHTCLKPCYQTCGPCEMNHNQLCEHRTRGKLCLLNCVWSCSHHQCLKRCYEPCDRQRCNEPCNARLSCGRDHKCTGLCGEGCPSVCRSCNRDQVVAAASFFGRKYTKKSRFVQLYCGHLFEVRDLDRHMAPTLSRNRVYPVGMKTCPKCNKSILTCTRYKTLIKQNYNDITAVIKRLKYANEDIYLPSAKTNIRYLVKAIISLDQRESFLNRVEEAASLSEMARIEYSIIRYRDIATVKCMLQSVLSAMEKHKSEESYLVNSVPPSFENDVKRIVDEMDQQMANAYSPVYSHSSPSESEMRGCYNYAFFRLHEHNNPIPPEPADGLYSLKILKNLQRKHPQVLSTMITPSTYDVSSISYRSWASGDWFKCTNGHVFYYPLTSVAQGDLVPQCCECFNQDIGQE